jgi:hypothetical protein
VVRARLLAVFAFGVFSMATNVTTPALIAAAATHGTPIPDE